MIKIPKKQLYNSLFSSQNPSRLNIIINASFFIFFYIIVPSFLLSLLKVRVFIPFIFYSLLVLIIFYLINNFYKNKSYVQLETQEVQVKINTQINQIEKQSKLKSAWEFKISRYNCLKNVIQNINTAFELDSIVGHLLDTAFTQIGRASGVCLLYFVDARNQRLNLYTSKKEDPGIIIKAKQGDIFDKWVLKHAGALFIEDTRKDFRFDIDKMDEEQRRPILSLISSPLISEEKLLGIFRLDNPNPNFFSQDDLRFLNTIADLGAAALENLDLFQATQKLAINDDLTLLYRKGFFLERLEAEFERSLRKGGHLSLLMADIDQFKDYNDKFGHTAGDIVLKTMASTMIDFFKPENALLCRFGGEEFCILLPEAGKRRAFLLAERFRKIIKDKEIVLRRHKTHVTVSVGLASYPEDANSKEELLSKSDHLLYQAKQKGRNRVCHI